MLALDVVTLNLWGLPPPLAWPPRHVRFPRAFRYLRGFDVAAVQELWRPRPWRFARMAPPSWAAHEARSGLAISARVSVAESAHTFFRGGGRAHERSWLRKGFLRVTLEAPALPGGVVDIVTTHLAAYARKGDATGRARQVDELLEALAPRGAPVVLLGDFNFYEGDAEDRASAARLTSAGFVDGALLHDAGLTYEFGSERERFDRVLVRGTTAVPLRVASARVRRYDAELPMLADHRPVEARVVLGE